MGETGHLSCPLHFYNMLVHLIANGKTREENVAVKNIWQKDNLVFLDLYFYRIKRSQVIDSVYHQRFSGFELMKNLRFGGTFYCRLL